MAMRSKMKAEFIAAIDQGTTGTRFMIFNRAGEIVSSCYEEHRQIYPRAGWVEHDPLEIWQKTKRIIAGVLSSSGLNACAISGIGITNQRETVVVWDRATGQPLYKCYRLAMHAHAGILPEAHRRRAGANHPRQDRPGGCHLFLRPQDRLDIGECPGRARQGRAWRSALWKTWIVG